MRTHCLLFVAIALPQFAQAELHVINRSSLGMVQGTIDFCARVNSPAAERFKEQTLFLAQGVSDEELARLSRSTEYREAYLYISAALGRLTSEQAATACNGLLETSSKISD